MSVRSVRSRSSRRSRGGRSASGGLATNKGGRDIFEDHTIAQIQRKFDENQRLVDQKQSELRQLVGARYRDLIEAADSIVVMNEVAQETQAALDRVAATSTALLARVSSPVQAISAAEAAASRDQRVALYTVAAQLKLLVDTPEQIWAALESKRHLAATLLFTLAENIRASLLSSDAFGGSMRSRFPVFVQQWKTISQFPGQILAGARASLKATTSTVHDHARALASVAMLDGRSQADLLDEFLAARAVAVRECLAAFGTPAPAPDGMSVDAPISPDVARASRLVRILSGTLTDVHKIFVRQSSDRIEVDDTSTLAAGAEVTESGLSLSSSSSLLASTSRSAGGIGTIVGRYLSAFVYEDAGPLSDDDFSRRINALFADSSDDPTLRYLPPAVRSFARRSGAGTATTSPASAPLPAAEVRQACSAWFERVTTLFAEAGPAAFAALDDAVVLREAELAVWRALASVETAYDEHWDTLCAQTVGETVAIWDRVFRDLFVAQAKTIVHGLFDEVTMLRHVEAGMAADAEGDGVGDFVWGNRDSAAQAANAVVSPATSEAVVSAKAPADKPLIDERSLAARSLCVTDALSSVVAAIDDQLEAVADALGAILFVDLTAGALRSAGTAGTASSAALRAGKRGEPALSTWIEVEEVMPASFASDLDEMRAAFRADCARVLSSKFQALDALRMEVDRGLGGAGSTDGDHSAPATVDDTAPLVFIGRVFFTLCHHSNGLARVFRLCRLSTEQDSDRRLRRRNHRRALSLSAEATQLRDLLLNLTAQSFARWAATVADEACGTLEAAVTSEVWSGRSRRREWAEVRLAATADSEPQVRLPSHPSPHVIAFLVGVCRCIDGAACHMLPPRVRSVLLDALRDGVSRVYDGFDEESDEAAISDVGACQLLFDARFLFEATNNGGGLGADGSAGAAAAAVLSDAELSALYNRLPAPALATLARFESRIDVVDLVVFGPRIEDNVRASLRRMRVLLGALGPGLAAAASSGQQSSEAVGGGQQRADVNTVFLAPVAARFAHLPITRPARRHDGRSSGAGGTSGSGGSLSAAMSTDVDGDGRGGDAGGGAGGASGVLSRFSFMDSVKKGASYWW